jgi:DNA-cytosine methyltransferase
VRHASFFSGVGGLDLGFERAGIKTVSVCEIDPYASSVLAERFPEAPNLGSITEINADDIPEADIWSGGFPCQDLSVAGKRAGFAGKRSSLAFTFLDLVERRRPRWLVLENVPGLFSSNHGADFARLLHEMEQLGYSVAWRTLDARYFGVPQRRRRVFIVASLEPDRAAEVLFECEGCERHPAPSRSQREGVTSSTPDGSGIAGAITGRFGKGVNSTIDEPLIISTSPDTNGVRETNGLARRVDDQQILEAKGMRIGSFAQYVDDETASPLRAAGGDIGGGSENLAILKPVVAYQTRVDEKAGNFTINQVEVANSLSALWPADTSHRSMTLVSTAEDIISFPSAYSRQPTKFNNVADPLTLSAGAPAVFRKSSRAQTNEDSETWVEGDVANTINSFDVGDIRTTHAIVGATGDDDEFLPDKLDGHRYRCCGNGVVAPVAEWIGRRIVSVNMLG